ncbi:hypothetical protein GC207_05075 [bacterium]|nr:hypothetical protein [bacterium]
MQPLRPLVLVFVLVGLFGFILSGDTQDHATQAQTGAPRFQILAATVDTFDEDTHVVSSSKTVIKLDTTTGQSWWLVGGFGTNAFPHWVELLDYGYVRTNHIDFVPEK